jgi:DNA-binding CsgD family transcriptional regulator
LTIRSVVEIQFGDLTAAAASIGEFCAVVEGTEVPEQPYAAQLLAAWQGRERRAGELIAATSAESERRGEGSGLIAAGWMRALVSNGRGRYDEALVAARQAVDVDLDMGVLTWAPLTELIVAAARSGRPDLGADAFRRLAELTQASGTNWALGLEAFGRALLADGPAVESSYREAIDRLARTRVRGLLARTHLHYGEWLRRQRRRVDAREQLRTAHELFTATDMDGFAGLAARELGATGETVRKRHAETSSRLTAQEAQVARLVGDGLSNAEVAARMFISRRTVEWHLSQVFAKLQVTSRQQLRR